MADQKKNQSGGFNPIGLCMGLGIGLCFSVALGRRKADDDKPEDKPDDGSGEEEK